MTVKELIEILQALPEDATIFREGGEYIGDYRRVTDVNYYQTAGWDIYPNSVILI